MVYGGTFTVLHPQNNAVPCHISVNERFGTVTPH